MKFAHLATLIFTASLLLLSNSAHANELMLASTAAPERKHRDRRPEDLIPSDHGIELNRDFTNLIQYGLIEGMFRVKKSGLPDCIDEGMTIFRATRRMSAKMQTEETRDDDFLNLF